MSRKFHSPRRSTFLSVGWLFADLLLALAMIFLVANTINIPKPSPTPTPTITPVKPTPTPTPVLRLETIPTRFSITIDPNGLLAGSQSAVNSVIHQVQGQAVLRGRKVGLAIVYVGAPTVNDINTSISVASKIYDVLRTFARGKNAFTNASYYDPLYLYGDSNTTAVIDVFLFTQT